MPAIKQSLVLGVLALILAFTTAKGSEVTIGWDAPTTDVELHPLDEPLIGYQIYYGVSTGTWENCVYVEGQRQVTLTNLEEGTTYTISVTACSEAGGESDRSVPLDVRAPDWTPPTLVIAETRVITADANGQSRLPDLRGTAQVTDNCSMTSNITLIQTPAPSTACGYGTIPVCVQAVDEAGNMTEQTVQVTVMAEGGSLNDLDADALADGWEQAMFHGLAEAQAGADEDFDGDGASNLSEYVAGTDPRDAGSRHALDLQRGEGGTLRMIFIARRAEGPGYEACERHFRLEYCSDPAVGHWVPVDGYDDIPGEDQTVVFQTGTLSERRGFYRSRVWLN